VSTFAFWIGAAHAQLPTSVGWTALPASTSLQGSGSCPPNNFEGDPFLFSEFCQNVIRTWNGAIADTTANRLIIWGGGHNNYYGNEIYSLNLTANPITLTRIKDPTVPTNNANNKYCIDAIPPSSPNAPNSREDYGGLAFIPGPYQMFIEGGSLACLEGDQSQNTWTISLSNLSDSSTWIHQNPAPPLPGSDGGITYGNVAGYDPNSGLVFLSDSSAIYSFNYQTGNYALVSAPEGFVTSIYLSGVIDPVRKLFVLMGDCSSTTSCGPGDGVFVADISDPSTTTMQNWTAATMADPNCAEFLSGGTNPINPANPGVAYDSVANDYVGWPNQGNSVYVMTPDTVNRRLTCQIQTFANGPPNSAHANDTANTSYGTFGRFQYFPALDVFVLVNDWNIPAYIFRLRSGTGYTLSATPSTDSLNPGGSASYTVTVNPMGSFTGTVDLSASGLPSGATASFFPTSISTSGSSTLTITTAANSSASRSTLTVSGTSGSLTQTANVNLDVTASPDFTITATPGNASVNPGGSVTYATNIGALNGFAGTVNFSATGLPAGASASFSPASIVESGTSTMTITTTTGTPTGSSTLTITATSGSLDHSANVILNVNTLSSSATSISIDFVGSGTAMAASETAGAVPESNWNQEKGASNSTGQGLVDDTGSATTASVVWKSDNVWELPITDGPGNVRMVKGYLDAGSGDTTTVTVSGLPSSANGYTVYVYADGDNKSASRTGVYQVSGSGITTTSISLTDLPNTNFSGTFKPATSSSPDGNYVVFTIPNVSGFTLSAIPSTASDGTQRAPVNGIQIVPVVQLTPDFTISATPATQTLTAGGGTTYTVSVGALNGFSGSVNLSVSGLPTGATGTFSPTSISPGTNSVLTVTTGTTTPAGSPTLTVTGTSGTLSHTATVTLTVTAMGGGTGKPISINFVGSGTAMAATETAGVVAAESNWNQEQGASSSTTQGLVDDTGSATTASVTWKADNVWELPITDEPGNVRMMKGYLDTGSADTTTVTVSGLPSSANGYTVYVYADGDNKSASRTGVYQVSGSGITTTSISLTDLPNTNFSGTFKPATSSSPDGNYVVFTIPNVSGFTLSAIPSTASDGTQRAPLNGIQIVPN
jgi:hypothetical protein